MKTIEEWDGNVYTHEILDLTEKQYQKIINFYELQSKHYPKKVSVERVKYLIDNYITKEKRTPFAEMGKIFKIGGSSIHNSIFYIYKSIFELIKHPIVKETDIPDPWEYQRQHIKFPYINTEHENILDEMYKNNRYLREIKKKQDTYARFLSHVNKNKNDVLKFNYENFKKQKGQKSLIADCEKCKNLFIITNLTVYVKRSRPIFNCLNCNEILVY